MNCTRIHHRNTRSHAMLGCVVCVALLAGGCTTGAMRGGADDFHPVFPPPPAQPRLVHVQNLRSSSDLKSPGLWQKILGHTPQHLSRPSSIAIDGAKLYITDQDTQGLHVFDQKAGKNRFFDRVDSQRRFVSPVGVAVLKDRLAVADSALKTVALLSDDGKPIALLDAPEGFQRPTGLAYDAFNHELYVVDTLAHTVYVFNRHWQMARRFGGYGNQPGQFNYPTHIAVDTQGQVYVSDSMNFRVQVFDRQGNYRGHMGKIGNASGHMAVPKGVAVNAHGHIYVIDSYLTNVQIFNQQGQLLLHFGGNGEQSGQFNVPTGLAADENRVYICDSDNHRIQIFEYLGGPSDDRIHTDE